MHRYIEYPMSKCSAFCKLPNIFHCNRFKNNKEVKPSATIVASAENESITLTLKEAKIEDAGVYRCEASNKLGSVKTESKLIIEGTRSFRVFFHHICSLRTLYRLASSR
jgi:hypothetical protein